MSPITPISPIPDNALSPVDPSGFLEECGAPNQLIYFLLNVGDGDTQLILLPSGGEDRRAIVVDVSGEQVDKLPALVLALQGSGILKPLSDDPADPARTKPFPIVIGTHPHDDHIGGMAQFLRTFGAGISEYWDPGYYHPTGAFIDSMKQLEDQPEIVWTQPSSGFRRFIDDVRITVLGPGVVLKNQYDSYGVDPNDASITLRLEFPYRRVQERSSRVAAEPVASDERVAGRLYAKPPKVRALVLGADAQARAWAQVQADFPKLESEFSPIFEPLRKAQGLDLLSADILKVSHHGSKRGVYLELVELLGASLSLVSSVGGGGSYNFPHALTQDALREARQKLAADPDGVRKRDYELGILYTADQTTLGQTQSPLGTVAVVVPPAVNQPMQVWRFGDSPKQLVDLNKARRFLSER